MNRKGAELPGGGVLVLSEDGPAFCRMLKAGIRTNRKAFQGTQYQRFVHSTQGLDDLWRYLSRYVGIAQSLPDVVPNPAHDVIVLCIFNAMLSLYTSHKLTAEGLYGPARPHLRHAFESLVIAKFCSVDPSSDVFDRWVDGMDVYFSNSILKKIAKPSTTELAKAWSLLCNWSHASVYSGQLTMRHDKVSEHALWNLTLIAVFIQWLYHLINSHMITPSVRFYGDHYAQSQAGALAKKRLAKLFREEAAHFGPGARRLVHDFRLTWTLK